MGFPQTALDIVVGCSAQVGKDVILTCRTEPEIVSPVSSTPDGKVAPTLPATAPNSRTWDLSGTGRGQGRLLCGLHFCRVTSGSRNWYLRLGTYWDACKVISSMVGLRQRNRSLRPTRLVRMSVWQKSTTSEGCVPLMPPSRHFAVEFGRLQEETRRMAHKSFGQCAHKSESRIWGSCKAQLSIDEQVGSYHSRDLRTMLLWPTVQRRLRWS